MLTNTFTADACAWCFVMSGRCKHNTRPVFSVPRCMLASKELLPRVAHIGPIFTGQIPPILVYYYICNLHINIDPNATLLVNGDRVTRVQLFMHKNAWHWDLTGRKIEFLYEFYFSFLHKAIIMSSIVLSAVILKTLNLFFLQKKLYIYLTTTWCFSFFCIFYFLFYTTINYKNQLFNFCTYDHILLRGYSFQPSKKPKCTHYWLKFKSPNTLLKNF